MKDVNATAKLSDLEKKDLVDKGSKLSEDQLTINLKPSNKEYEQKPFEIGAKDIWNLLKYS
jgi:hypothetical protein